MLNAKNAVISGGTTGIGKKIAERLLASGANILIIGNKNVEVAIRDLEGLGNVKGINFDLSLRDNYQELFKEIDSHFEQVDIIVNNAGLGDGNLDKHRLKVSDTLLSVNLFSYVALCKYAFEKMKPRLSGHIVNIGSMSAGTNDAGSEVYNVSKAGVRSLSQSVRKVYNPYGIKVTLIEPGAVATPMQTETPKDQIKGVNAGIFLKPDDIADTVMFALTAPKNCDVIEIKVKPLKQFI